MRHSLWIGMLLAAAISLAACNVDQSSGTAGSTNANQAADANTGENPAGANPAGGTTGTNPQGQNPAAPTLSTDQTAAIQQFSQLTVGILYLQDNQAGSITKDQAAALLTYYQDIQTNLQQVRDAVNNGTPQAGGPDPGGPGGPGDGKGGFGGGFGSLANIDLAKLRADLTGIQSTLTADQLAAINALTEDQIAATTQQHGGGMPGGPPVDGTQGSPPQPQGTPDPDQMATMQAQGGPGRPGGRQVGSPLLEEVITVLMAIAAG